MNSTYLKRYKQRYSESGYSFIELIVTMIILGILSSLAFVNLSMRMNKERLKSTARSMENWINTQRNLAMQNNLTCKVLINKSSLMLSSENLNSTSAGCDPNQSSASTFNVMTSFGQNSPNLVMTFEPSSAQTGDQAEILFSFRGFSENTNLPISGAPFEIKLRDPGLKAIRCVKIISPIGLIRDGYALDSTSSCIYNNPI